MLEKIHHTESSCDMQPRIYILSVFQEIIWEHYLGIVLAGTKKSLHYVANFFSLLKSSVQNPEGFELKDTLDISVQDQNKPFLKVKKSTAQTGTNLLSPFLTNENTVFVN